MSLLFGCMYILRFNTMRMPHKAIQWAQVCFLVFTLPTETYDYLGLGNSERAVQPILECLDPSGYSSGMAGMVSAGQ